VGARWSRLTVTSRATRPRVARPKLVRLRRTAREAVILSIVYPQCSMRIGDDP
jgi:hypothetical protein